MKGLVNNQPCKIIIDSGAVSNIVAHQFLKKIDWKIQKPSTVNLIGINGQKEKALGEVIDLPVTLGSTTIKIKALVTVNGDYDLILGNDWAQSHKAILNWNKGLLQFENEEKQVETTVTCLEKRNESIDENNLFNIDEELEIKVFDNNGKGRLPERAHETDAGFDLKYSGSEDLTIPPFETIIIDSQIAIEVPKGTFCQLASRSSLARKGIEVKAGTIDAGYTGNIKILVYNNSQ
jgi:deoxycytidine triphosphate deaminase